jgi:hypothetical protein
MKKSEVSGQWSVVSGQSPQACVLRFFCLLSFVLCVLLFSGCATQTRNAAAVGHRPVNVFSYAPHLPSTLQRVAVLPLVFEQPQADLPEGCEALNPALFDELVKTKRFEVVSVSRDHLSSRMGRSDWTGAEALPADFFESLHRSFGCDAVLFCELTVFHAYAPLSVGWRLKLVDARTRQIVWSADEVFNGPPRTVNPTESFCEFWFDCPPSSDNWAFENSPRQFGQYAAAQLFATLPSR